MICTTLCGDLGWKQSDISFPSAIGNVSHWVA